MRNLHPPFEEADLVECLDVWREATVDAEDFAFDDGTDTEVVEDLTAVLPGVDVAVLAHGLFVETVDRGDAACLVIASKKGDAVGVLELEAEEKLESFNTVPTTVDVVTHKDVARVGDLTTYFKQLKKVVELAVDVTADCDGGAHGLHVALLNEDLFDFLAQDP